MPTRISQTESMWVCNIIFLSIKFLYSASPQLQLKPFNFPHPNPFRPLHSLPSLFHFLSSQPIFPASLFLTFPLPSHPYPKPLLFPYVNKWSVSSSTRLTIFTSCGELWTTMLKMVQQQKKCASTIVFDVLHVLMLNTLFYENPRTFASCHSWVQTCLNF